MRTVHKVFYIFYDTKKKNKENTETATKYYGNSFWNYVNTDEKLEMTS